MKIFDLIGFGAVSVDDLFYVDHYPMPDSKVSIKKYDRQGGGLAGTALVTAARLGAKVAYCGSFGYDELSNFSLGEFKKEGIDLQLIEMNSHAAPIHSIIIIDSSNGKRVILHSGSGLSSPPEENITEELISSSKYIFVDHTVVQCSILAASLASKLIVPVIADIERDDNERIAELLKYINHLIINQSMAKKLTGCEDIKDSLNLLYRTGQSVCVITAGSDGCYYRTANDNFIHFPAFDVPIIDTTGCGDVFHGAYAAGLIKGYSISKSIIFATAAAGIKVTHRGGRSGIPTLIELNEFLINHGYKRMFQDL